MFNEVKDAGAYWTLIKKATNQNIKTKISALKRDNGTLALINKEDKATFSIFIFQESGRIQPVLYLIQKYLKFALEKYLRFQKLI